MPRRGRTPTPPAWSTPFSASSPPRRSPGPRIFESPAAFAERLGHPLWLVERWITHYGREATLAICEYDQLEPHSGALFPSFAGRCVRP